MSNEIVELEEDELKNGQVRLKLLPSEEEESWGNPDFQRFLEQVAGDGADITAINSIDMQSAPEVHLLSGAFVLQLASILGPAVAAGVTGWLAGRTGRKVRLKVGDIEAEARTIKEVGQLLQRAQALQASQESAKSQAGTESDTEGG
jgi:hypothetical protein